MHSNLVHSPKGLRSSGLEEKSSGTPDRTSEKQNNCMDWSRTPNIPTTAITPLHFQNLLGACCVTAANFSALHSQTAPPVLQSPSHSVKTIWVIHVLSPSNPTPPPAAMLPTVLYHLGDLPVDTDQAWSPHHLISPCCSHSHYTTHCLAELWVCALKKWEFSRCGRQNNPKINLFRENTWGTPGSMKHVKYIKCTINV